MPSAGTCDAVQERLAALSLMDGSAVPSASPPVAAATNARMNAAAAADAAAAAAEDSDSKAPPAKDTCANAGSSLLQMQQLPPEVVAIVLLHVDFADIPSVAVVSKEWSSALTNGEDEHYLYLLRRHKSLLSKFSDKVLEVDGGSSADNSDNSAEAGPNFGGVEGGNNVVANAGDNTGIIINNNAAEELGADIDNDKAKPSPKWKMLFRRALFIMKMAHNPRLKLNVLDGPNNRASIPGPRPSSAYGFNVNVRVLSNDPSQGTDNFSTTPDQVSGSDFDSDGCLPVEITRNNLCPIPASKLAKGFVWISLRHSQSRSVPVIFRGSYTSVDGLKFKKRYKWKDMELPNGDLVVMGRRLCLSTRNHVESIAGGGKIKVRLRFDMESLPVGNGSGDKEMFQDLSHFEVLRVMESLLFVNGPRVVLERPKASASDNPAAASIRSTARPAGHSQGTTTNTTTDSLLPPSFANVEAATARTAAAFERLSLEMAENRESLAVPHIRQRILERERRRRLYPSRRGRFQTAQGSSGPAGTLVGTAASPAAESQQQQIFRFGSDAAAPVEAAASSGGSSQRQPFRFGGSSAAASLAVGNAGLSAGESQRRQPFRFGSGTSAPSSSLGLRDSAAEAARRFVDSRRTRISTDMNGSNAIDGPSETEVDENGTGRSSS